MSRIILAVAAAMLLAACTAEVNPHGVELSAPHIHFGHGHGGGHGCPPGLEMQGRC